MYKILLAEDNSKLRLLMERYLRTHGFDVRCAADGAEAIDLFHSEPFDLILLDILMPEKNGIDVCNHIRETSKIPILFLTALATEGDQLTGYGAGADDYIVKPFSLPVLVAKCNALLNRRGQQAEWIEHAGIRLSEEKHIAFVGDEPLQLSTTDFTLLAYFLKNPGIVLSREQIILHVWGDEYDGYDRSVDNHIKTLRRALGENGILIRIVIRRGYVMD